MFCVSSVNQLLSTGQHRAAERVLIDVADLEILVNPPVHPSFTAICHRRACDIHGRSVRDPGPIFFARRARAAEDVAHRVVPFVARVLEHVRLIRVPAGCSAAVHGRENVVGIGDGHLVADRVRVDAPELLGQVQRPGRRRGN